MLLMRGKRRRSLVVSCLAIPLSLWLRFCAQMRGEERVTSDSSHNGYLNEIRGNIDVVIMSQFLDLFHWHDQVAIGKTIVKLSHVGTKVVGCTFGTVKGNASDYWNFNDIDYQPPRLYHDIDSLQTLWLDIGGWTGKEWNWKVEAESVELGHWGFDNDDIAWMIRPVPRASTLSLHGSFDSGDA